ncbi:folylpolyglutamate synthase [Lithohypha guttulata]|nr:folylpolyglutamate synthase [Lithohypha guttulata]
MINLGLERIERLLQHIARNIFEQVNFNPPWKAIHIAGTNGKGSVAAYTSSLLRRAVTRKDGLPIRIGRFTSPHFIDRWDCISINDQPVSRDVFEKAEKQVYALKHTVSSELRGETSTASHTSDKQLTEDELRRETEPTEFELLTATAFNIFSQPDPRPCDIAVIECGLGGAEDATNVLPESAIGMSVITRIGLDHLGILGNDVKDIVRHKAGISRRGIKVIVDGDNEPEILRQIMDAIRTKCSYDEKTAGDMVSIVHGNELHESLVPGTTTRQNHPTAGSNNTLPETLQSLMPHQWSNLAVAQQATIHILHQNYQNHDSLTYSKAIEAPSSWPKLLEEVLRDASISYPARLQRLSPGWLNEKDRDTFPLLNDTPVLLDGAHNEQSAEVLRDYVDRATGSTSTTSRRPVIWILALSSTKSPEGIFKTLLGPRQPVDAHDTFIAHAQQTIIFTSFGPVDNMPWVRPAPVPLLMSAIDDAVNLPISVNIEHGTTNISEALKTAEGILAKYEGKKGSEKPLVVMAGSLYMASNVLRMVRDGREEFERWWDESQR